MTTRVLTVLMIGAIAALFFSPFVVAAISDDSSADEAPAVAPFKEAAEFYDSAWDKLIVAITLIFIIMGLFQWRQSQSFRDAKADLEAKMATMREDAQKDLDRAVGKVKAGLETQQAAVEAQKQAIDEAATEIDSLRARLERRAATLYSNLAHAYLTGPGCDLNVGLIYVYNAVDVAIGAGEPSRTVTLSMVWWLWAAGRHGPSSMPPSVPTINAIRENWPDLVALRAIQQDQSFSEKLQEMQVALERLVGGADALAKILATDSNDDASQGEES